MRFIDTHFHYGLLSPVSRERLKVGIAQEGAEIIVQTVRPSGFVELEHGNLPMVTVGYHPWYIDDSCERELEIFREALPHTRLVGETGLDFVPRRPDDAPVETQVYVFISILDATQASSLSYILSIHTVCSANTVLDLLEQDLVSNSGPTSGKNFVPILHRFGGTSDEPTRPTRVDGCISVNPLMLRTKRGRAYVPQMPVDKLLLETDLSRDPGSGNAVEVVSAILAAAPRDTVAEAATLRGMGEAELRNALAENAEALGT